MCFTYEMGFKGPVYLTTEGGLKAMFHPLDLPLDVDCFVENTSQGLNLKIYHIVVQTT